MTAIPVKAPGNTVPAAHALVIGVGNYPQLLATAQPKDVPRWGAPQIQSAADSAREFAMWLRDEYASTSQPLASLELLLSEPGGPSTFTAAGQPVAVDPAVMKNVKDAFKVWKARCHSHEDNLAIFYFAGHGVQRGVDMALLTELFGDDVNDIMADAIDLSRFIGGMERCMARSQLMVIDACRNTPDELLALTAGMGEALIAPNAKDFPSTLPRDNPVLLATGNGQTAGAPKAGLSRFTTALLAALRGLAGQETPAGGWEIRTDSLASAVTALLDLETRQTGLSPQKAFVGGNSSGFLIQPLAQPPVVPVLIGCNPASDNQEAALTIALGATKVAARNPDPSAADWLRPLPVETYDVHADFAKPPFLRRSTRVTVRPPWREARV